MIALSVCIDVDDKECALVFYTQGLSLRVDASVARLEAAGATLESPASEKVWGCITGLVNPFGHGIDLLGFKGRGYDELLETSP